MWVFLCVHKCDLFLFPHCCLLTISILLYFHSFSHTSYPFRTAFASFFVHLPKNTTGNSHPKPCQILSVFGLEPGNSSSGLFSDFCQCYIAPHTPLPTVTSTVNYSLSFYFPFPMLLVSYCC